MKKQYDVVVIGAGSSGLTSAVGFKKAGKSVLLVERAHMGGDCTNTGCIPSKSLLHHAKTYATAKHIAGDTADLAAYRREAFTYVRDKIAEILAEETPAHFEDIGIDVVLGEASFTGPCQLEVNGQSYDFKKAIIASGSRARRIPIDGLTDEKTLTNENIFDLSEAPEELLVVGGGPIGLEMSQAMAMLGTRVTMIVMESELGYREDKAVRKVLQESTAQLGITVHTDSQIERIENDTAIIKTTEGETFSIPAPLVLVAVGREVNLPKGLDTAGVAFTDRGITVNKNLRTTNKHIFAVGDVALRLKFTHTADDSARQVIAHILSKGLIRVKNKPVPKVTYTKPEVAQVGLSESEAIEKYGEKGIMRIEVPFSQSDRAKTESSTDGVLVVIVRRLSGKILGAHIIGPRAGELLSVYTLAISEKISMYKLQSLIYAYPTYSLIIKKAADLFFAHQLGSLKTDIIGLITRNAPKFIAAFFWATLILGFQYYKITTGQSYQDILFLLLDFFMSTMWGPILYILLYAVRPLILFPATLMTALSGALFGPILGIFYTVIGENASANLAYGVGRYFGKDLRLENTVIGGWVERLRENTFGAVLFMRLAYFPFDLTNYASGVVQAKWKQYFAATAIGIMPGLTVFVLFGASFQDNLAELRAEGFNFESVDTNLLWISIAIFVVSLFLSRLLKKRHA